MHWWRECVWNAYRELYGEMTSKSVYSTGIIIKTNRKKKEKKATCNPTYMQYNLKKYIKLSIFIHFMKVTKGDSTMAVNLQTYKLHIMEIVTCMCAYNPYILCYWKTRHVLGDREGIIPH